MNPPSGNEQHDTTALAAVVEWQKKYTVKDGDPLFASIELFQIYFGEIQSTAKSETSRIPSFVEFRDSLELIDGCGKRFSKQAAELIDAMRGVQNIRKQVQFYHAVLFALLALLCVIFGIYIGMFIL